jgi:transcription elongation factor Elf1
LECKKCGVEFQTTINYLSESIDVYSDWVDACEATNKQGEGRGNARGSNRRDEDSGDDGLDGGDEYDD